MVQTLQACSQNISHSLTAQSHFLLCKGWRGGAVALHLQFLAEQLPKAGDRSCRTAPLPCLEAIYDSTCMVHSKWQQRSHHSFCRWQLAPPTETERVSKWGRKVLVHNYEEVIVKGAKVFLLLERGSAMPGLLLECLQRKLRHNILIMPDAACRPPNSEWQSLACTDVAEQTSQ